MVTGDNVASKIQTFRARMVCLTIVPRQSHDSRSANATCHEILLEDAFRGTKYVLNLVVSEALTTFTVKVDAVQVIVYVCPTSDVCGVSSTHCTFGLFPHCSSHDEPKTGPLRPKSQNCFEVPPVLVHATGHDTENVLAASIFPKSAATRWNT